MSKENANKEEACTELSNQIICSIKTLFESLDKQHTGLVHISQIKNRWKENAIPSLPGVYESFKRVAPASGLLNFDTFLLGIKLAVRRREETLNSNCSRKLKTWDLYSQRKDKNHLGIPKSADKKNKISTTGLDNPKSQHFFSNSSELKHRRSHSGPVISSGAQPATNPLEKRFSSEALGYSYINKNVINAKIKDEKQTKKNLINFVRKQTTTDESSANLLSDIQTKKNLNGKTKSYQFHTTSKPFLKTVSNPNGFLLYGDSGQYGSLKRPAMSTPNKQCQVSDGRSTSVSKRSEKTDSCFHQNTKNIEKYPLSDHSFSRKITEGFAALSSNKTQDTKQTEPFPEDLLHPRQLTTPLPPGRLIEKRAEHNNLLSINPRGFFSNISDQTLQRTSTNINCCSLEKKEKSKMRNRRRHTVANGIPYELLQDIEILNEEKRSLARGLDVIDQARFWFHHRLQDIDEHRGSMENSTRFKTTTLLSRDDLSKLSARIEALVKVIGSLFETRDQHHFNQLELKKLHENTQKKKQLTKENELLTLKVSNQSKKIDQLEKEKTELIRQLFQAKATSRELSSRSSNNVSTSL